jgi:hypothetical protein
MKQEIYTWFTLKNHFYEDHIEFYCESLEKLLLYEVLYEVNETE